ncbi:hypothetical protein [Ostreiculturibacter nitratireducens]|uniref:hypothetical protein n=1 Tax=Ostreiculturibacter nitratireducens TaxID=3075226 RepID=UPI0031B644CD
MTERATIRELLLEASEAARPGRDAVRALVPTPEAGHLGALIMEIGETILPRRLTFSFGRGSELFVEAGNRRLLGIGFSGREAAERLGVDASRRSKELQSLCEILIGFVEDGSGNGLAVRSDPSSLSEGAAAGAGFSLSEIVDALQATESEAEPADEAEAAEEPEAEAAAAPETEVEPEPTLEPEEAPEAEAEIEQEPEHATAEEVGPEAEPEAAPSEDEELRAAPEEAAEQEEQPEPIEEAEPAAEPETMPAAGLGEALSRPRAMIEACEDHASVGAIASIDGKVTALRGDEDAFPIGNIATQVARQVRMNSPFLDVTMPGEFFVLMGPRSADLPSLCYFSDGEEVIVSTVSPEDLDSVLSGGAREE